MLGAQYRAIGPDDVGTNVASGLTLGAAVVPTALPGCTSVEAFSPDDSTIACRSDGGLRIFQLAPDGTLARDIAVADSTSYQTGEFRRVFSNDGRWFVYDDGSLRLIDTANAANVSVLLTPHAQASLYTSLEIKKDRLFYHRGTQLAVIQLGENASVEPLSGSISLAEPLQCYSAHLAPGPDRWCGAAIIPATVFPAPDGQRTVFLDASRHPYITSINGSGEARPLGGVPVKCLDEVGEIRCDLNVAWAPE